MATLPTIVGASPINSNDGSRYTGFAIDTDAQTVTFALGDTPTDFATMASGLTYTYDGNETVTGGIA